MALNTMYPGLAYSPPTELSQPLGPADTTIYVEDVSVFPAAPNIAVIGVDENAETILYTGLAAGALTGVQRAIEGTAVTWNAGESIGRNFTAYDYQRLIDNITALDNALSLEATARETVGDMVADEIQDRKDAVDALIEDIGDLQTTKADKSAVYTKAEVDDEIAEAQLSTQTWLPAVQTMAALPTNVPKTGVNYLIRVIADTNASNNGVYQSIAGATTTANWTYFSDNADWVDEDELAEAIAAHAAAQLPHSFTVGGVTYNWGLSVDVNGVLGFSYQQQEAN